MRTDQRVAVAAAVVSSLLLWPTRMMAFRAEFIAFRDSERLAGAEVCFLQGDPDNQLTSYFSGSEMRCLPADKVLELPVGSWHFFGRHRDGFVTDWPGFITVPREVEGYKAIKMDF